MTVPAALLPLDRDQRPRLTPTTMSRLRRERRTARLVGVLAAGGDPDELRSVRAELVLVNRGVADAIANRYRGRGVGADDLAQAAYEGLTKAVARFEPTMDSDLLSYAVPVIRGEVRRYFRDHGWTVRPTRGVQELQWRITHARDELHRELGREPAEAEMVARLQVDPASYREAVEAFGCFQPLSLDRPVRAESSMSLRELLAGTQDPCEAVDARLVVSAAMQALADQDRRILNLRFVEELTQSEIAERLGLTQMKVSRQLHRILDQLRAVIGEYDGLGCGERAG